MESTRRTSPAPEAERKDQRSLKEQTDKEIAERVSSPPEQPTPTQEEADAFKEGAAEAAEPPPEAPAGETAQHRREREQKEREEKERQQRDVKPEQGRSGYQTRT